MAARKEVECAGGSWDPLRGCAVSSPQPAQPDEEVECLGQSTHTEAEAARDEAGRQAAVDLDSEDEAIGGGAAMPNALEGIPLSFSDLSQDTSQ